MESVPQERVECTAQDEFALKIESCWNSCIQNSRDNCNSFALHWASLIAEGRLNNIRPPQQIEIIGNMIRTSFKNNSYSSLFLLNTILACIRSIRAANELCISSEPLSFLLVAYHKLDVSDDLQLDPQVEAVLREELSTLLEGLHRVAGHARAIGKQKETEEEREMEKEKAATGDAGTPSRIALLTTPLASPPDTPSALLTPSTSTPAAASSSSSSSSPKKIAVPVEEDAERVSCRSTGKLFMLLLDAFPVLKRMRLAPGAAESLILLMLNNHQWQLVISLLKLYLESIGLDTIQKIVHKILICKNIPVLETLFVYLSEKSIQERLMFSSSPVVVPNASIGHGGINISAVENMALSVIRDLEAVGGVVALRTALVISDSFKFFNISQRLARTNKELKISNFVAKGKWELARQSIKWPGEGVFLFQCLIDRELYIEADMVYKEFNLQRSNVQTVDKRFLIEQERKNEMNYLRMNTNSIGMYVVDSVESVLFAAAVLEIPVIDDENVVSDRSKNKNRTNSNRNSASTSSGVYSVQHGDGNIQLSAAMERIAISDFSTKILSKKRNKLGGKTLSTAGMSDGRSNSSNGSSSNREISAVKSASTISEKRPYRTVVGLDSEWRAELYKKHSGGASILQIATFDWVFIFDLKALASTRIVHPSTITAAIDTVALAVGSEAAEAIAQGSPPHAFPSPSPASPPPPASSSRQQGSLPVVSLRGLAQILLKRIFSDPDILKIGFGFFPEDAKAVTSSAEGAFAEVLGGYASFLDVSNIIRSEEALVHFNLYYDEQQQQQQGQSQGQSQDKRNDGTTTSTTTTTEEEEEESVGRKDSGGHGQKKGGGGGKRGGGGGGVKQNESLSNACNRFLGKPLLKNAQMSNWDERPLSKMQIVYASLDAHCLVGILAGICIEQHLLRAAAHSSSSQVPLGDESESESGRAPTTVKSGDKWQQHLFSPEVSALPMSWVIAVHYCEAIPHIKRSVELLLLQNSITRASAEVAEIAAAAASLSLSPLCSTPPAKTKVGADAAAAAAAAVNSVSGTTADV